MSDEKRDIAQIVVSTLKTLFEYFSETLKVYLNKVIDKVRNRIYIIAFYRYLTISSPKMS
jgi:hypothetical protein